MLSSSQSPLRSVVEALPFPARASTWDTFSVSCVSSCRTDHVTSENSCFVTACSHAEACLASSAMSWFSSFVNFRSSSCKLLRSLLVAATSRANSSGTAPASESCTDVSVIPRSTSPATAACAAEVASAGPRDASPATASASAASLVLLLACCVISNDGISALKEARASLCSCCRARKRCSSIALSESASSPITLPLAFRMPTSSIRVVRLLCVSPSWLADFSQLFAISARTSSVIDSIASISSFRVAAWSPFFSWRSGTNSCLS
mmetsp:Transcript_160561/g.308316  ORF Transcript_160561/g.308316 Transcript_160561/m.308316 type:complete len:265 (-) Transcript_160561:1455-2249(-)